MPNTKPRRDPSTEESKSSNLRRVDFLGSALFAAFLVALLLPLELGGSRVAWSDPVIPICVAVAALLLVLFVAAEKWWAANPLLPLSMFRNRHTVAAFIIMALQCAAQLGVRPNTCLLYCFDPDRVLDDDDRSAVFSSHAEDEQLRCWQPPASGCHWKCRRRHHGRVSDPKVRPDASPQDRGAGADD